MNVPEWLKPGLYGAAVGGIVLAIVGFTWAGWVTGGTAEKMAATRARADVVTALVPFCVAMSQSDPLSAERLAELGKASAYQRGDLLMKAGWATMPGATAPDRDLANACVASLAAQF